MDITVGGHEAERLTLGTPVLNDKMREGDEASMIRLKYRIENRGREPPNGQANSYGGGGGYNPQSHFGGYNMAAQRGGGGLSMPNSDKCKSIDVSSLNDVHD